MPDREILFQGKRADNGEWVYGYYCHIGPTGKEKHYIIPSYASAFYGIEVDPSTVSRYTGLTDKHGTRIFEGHLLYNQHENANYIVEWSEEKAMFQMVHGRRVGGMEMAFYCGVIGNRWDNPELMGGDTDV